MHLPGFRWRIEQGEEVVVVVEKGTWRKENGDKGCEESDGNHPFTK